MFKQLNDLDKKNKSLLNLALLPGFYISDIKLQGFGYHLVYKNKNALSIEEQKFRKWIKGVLQK